MVVRRADGRDPGGHTGPADDDGPSVGEAPPASSTAEAEAPPATASSTGTTGPAAPAAPGTPAAAPTRPASSGRFEGDATLGRVIAGRASLGPGARGEAVTRVQQALIDTGFALPVGGADGGYGDETVRAVRRFQRDVGLPQTGRVDRATLRELDRVAPPSGRTLERFPEYERLFADGRLDVTAAFGYDEDQNSHQGERLQFQEGLRRQGYRQLDVESLSAERRARLGLGADRYEPGATYYHRQIREQRTGHDVDVVVRVLHPGSAPADQPERVRDMFSRALAQDEVVMYGGHARHGSGPDFDPIGSGRGNFVIDRAGNPADPPTGELQQSLRGGPDTMLRGVEPQDPNRYRLLYFNACSTESYLRNLRDPRVNGALANGRNTDVVGTTVVSALATTGDQLGRFLQGLERQESIDTIHRDQNRTESEFWQRWPDRPELVERSQRARGAFHASGFLDNSGNQVR